MDHHPDTDTIYEEESIELHSDAKERNTDSEEEHRQKSKQNPEEIVIFENRPATRRVVKRQQTSVGAVAGSKLVGQIKQEPTGVIPKVSTTMVNPSGIKLVAAGQKTIQNKMTTSLGHMAVPLKRKSDGSPMIVKLDSLKKARTGEQSTLVRPGVSTPQQNRVLIMKHDHTQTDMTGDIMDQYQVIIEEDQQKIAMLEEQVRKLKYTPEMFENDDKRTEYFTGMESFVTMITLYNTCEADLPASSALTKFEIYMLTLLKLRLKLPLPFLGYMFGVSPRAATYFYNECLGVLHGALREVFSETIEAVEAK